MNHLLAGATKMEITPQQAGLRMGGHGVNRRVTGIRDPLWARALALSDGGSPLVIVSLDLVGLMHGYVERIRDRLPQLDRSRVWVCSTHTHDSPDTIGFWGPMIAGLPLRSGLDDSYMEFVVDTSADAARRAVLLMRSANMTVAQIVTPSVGLSRNVRHEGLKDDQIQVIRFTNSDRETIAIIYHYACHPEFFGHSHKRVSAGWPGVTNEVLEDLLGGTAVFVQNSLGGMVTGAVSRDDGSFDPMVGSPFASRLGHMVARYIQQALADHGRAVDVPTITTIHETFPYLITNRLFLLAARLNVFPRWLLAADGRTVYTETNLARIGPVTMATVPGESLPSVGFAIKDLLGSEYTWVLNLANDELGYLLPHEFWADPNYRYEQSMSPGPEIVPLLLEKITRLRDQA